MKSLLFFLLLFTLTIRINAQDEKIIFDLDKGDFNVKKIPYVYPVTITGLAQKGGLTLDAVRLIVTKISDEDMQELDALRFKAGELAKQTEINNKSVEVINGLIATPPDDVDKLSKSLEEKGQLKLSASIRSIGSTVVDKSAEAKKLMEAEVARLKGELKTQDEIRIKQDAKILELQKEVFGAPFFDALWQRTSDEKEFSFSLGKKLEMSESYNFTFTAYQTNTTSFPVDKLLDPLITEFDKTLFEKGFYSLANINIRVKEVATTIENQLFPNIYELNDSGSEFVSKGLQLNSNRIDAISNALVQYYINLDEATNETENVKNIIEDLYASIKTNAALTVAELENFKLLIDKLEGYDASKMAAAVTSYAAAVQGDILTDYGYLKIHRDRLKSAADHAATYLNLIKDQFDFIKSLFIEKGNVTKTTPTSASSSTEVDGIRISTVYGVGMVPLENSFKAIEWYQFVAVNIRFDDFDNRLPGRQAYKSFWSRCAVMVGIATSSDMQYRGQKLENLRIGFKPVIGLSIEPLKHLSISSGIISFIPSAIGNSQNDPKVRPYISLGFDFNLFNYLIQKQ